MPGLGDGGAHVGTICDGSFPTTLLTHWGRDRTRGEQLDSRSWSGGQCRGDGPHRRARSTAACWRRATGPTSTSSTSTPCASTRRRSRFDLPAGGKRLLQRADGYRHTFVAGVEIYADGEHTGALPGRLVRGAQSAPA